MKRQDSRFRWAHQYDSACHCAEEEKSSAHAVAVFVAERSSSSLSSRRYKNKGKPSETPTVSTARSVSQRIPEPRLLFSRRVNTMSVTADATTSIPKKAPMRL